MVTTDPVPEGPGPRDGDWRVYRGGGAPHDGIDRLPPPPPWRRFGPGAGTEAREAIRPADRERAVSYRSDPRVVDKVNAALYLRRPLLVTGKPGAGKSTLAYNIAYELGLEPILYWPVSSRTTLQQGLYEYDAIGRVHETSLRRSRTGPAARPDTAGAPPDEREEPDGPDVPDGPGGPGGPGGPTEAAGAGEVDGTVPGIGRYIRLGPLGTALLPGERPRVLLIDELDKSDIDLPNDLLNVLEEGRFTIPELERLPDGPPVEVMTADDGGRAPISRGRVRCADFPIVIITSNGEREFPLAFLRRCVRVAIEPPTGEQLADIVAAHLGEEARTSGRALIAEFLDRRARGDLATDQLLNAIFLATSGSRPPESTLRELVEALLRPLDVTGPG
ncbi:MoxR family ATPase [Actinomadura viridis]|uniref:MoxR-like ATPase n=1 Tax=Actinomadura viridis TaxID=58110 RepID=A0A931DRJ0_9ACTN|nr:MoxR family ATPase [Actinomadura viridis]MBG6092652.1 MoxR-like ATPase [Actinomadura viridis]